jgi:hypothetical protein
MSFDRDLIIVQPGRLPEIVDEVEATILKDYAGHGLYQRGTFLVRVVTTTPEDAEHDEKLTHIKRSPGSAILRPATAPMLEDIFGRAMEFAKCTGKKGELVQIDCPSKVASIYLSRGGLWKVPVLTGIVSAPIIRPDGSILTTPGYDEDTGLLLQSPVKWTAPGLLSRAAVEDAVRILLGPFAEFRLRDETERSVIVSAILTGLQRRLLYSAPAHFFDAPVQSSGKTLIADCIAIIITGLPAALTSANADEDELRKKLVAILLGGDPVVNIDNITRPLSNDALASILTVDTYEDRILGVSQMSARLLTNILFLLTGNNLQFMLDMPSRVIGGRIEPDVERPEERTFAISDLREHVREHRIQLVNAAMTILQGYFLAGRPAQKLPECRFSQWSKEIRSAIVWAGLPDPCKTRENITASDPERESTLAVFSTWFEAAPEAVRLSRLVEISSSTHTVKVDEEVKVELIYSDLKAALLDVAADLDLKEQKQISTYRLAAWCRNRTGRIAGVFKLIKGSNARAGFATWQVVRAQAPATAEEPQHDEQEVTKELFN